MIWSTRLSQSQKITHAPKSANRTAQWKEVHDDHRTAQLKKLPGGLLISINRKVGLRLLTKFGSKGIINLHRAIPVLSALTGGTIEAASTWAVGNVARELFIEEDKNLIKVEP